MSYQLHLAPTDPERQAGSEARELLSRIATFGEVRLYDGGEWDMLYENPATGVRCGFHWRTSESGGADRILTFEIDTIRPLFFAIEALPHVTLLAADLGLTVREPATGSVLVPDAATLLSSWRRANEADVRSALEQGAELNHLPEPKAMEWWRYMSAKSELELSVPEGVFVPSIMVVRDRDGILQRIVVWPDAIPTLLPPCEYVLMSRGRNGMADDDRREIGAVPYEELARLLAKHLTTYEMLGLTIPMVPSDHDDVARIFAEVSLRDLDPGKVRIISPAQYHTVEGVQ